MPTNYTPGDEIICKVGYNKILDANSKDFEFTQPFDIICLSDSGYIILVSQSIHLTDSFTLTSKHCNIFKLNKKFIDGEAYYINDDHVVSVRSRMTGLKCNICEVFYEMAEPNDGNNLICWSCRNYKFYK